jgi:hypothetical protein
LEDVGKYKTWVGSGGISDHVPIFLDFEEMDQKPPSPFKFNHTCLQDESFISLVEKNWRKFGYDVGSSTIYQFSNNLMRLKKLTISWVKDK